MTIMKTMKSYIWMAAATMMAATLGACSNDDLTAIETPIQKGNVVTLTATLSPKDGDGTTRALSDPGDGTLHSTWAVNEEICVEYTNAYDGFVDAKGIITAVDGDGKATVSVNLVNPKDGNTDIYFHYPYVSYTGEKLIGMEQTGTLEDISANYDRVSGSGTLNVSGGTPTLPNDVGMTREVCIWKLAFTDGSNDITADITNLTISDGNGNDYIVSPPAGAKSAIWVAMAGIASKTVTITATTGSGLYTTEKSITLANGKFYRSTVPLTATTTPNKYVVYTSGVNHYDAVIPSVATTVTSSATGVTWEAGTYLVSADATIEGNVTLAGNVNLILCDGATLTINGKFVNPQDASGNYTYSMNIYGQSAGTGKLTIVNNDMNGIAHHLNVHGGVITLTDGGVDQGFEMTGRFNLFHGTINAYGSHGGVIALGDMYMYGGIITAGAENYSAGLYANQNFTMTGGTINAQCGSQGEGMQVCGEGVINGGTITSRGGEEHGVGIMGNLTISGGTVTAIGGDGKIDGFENGAAGFDGALTVNGGTFIATGGAKVGAGVDDGLGISDNSTITLSGVTMYEGDSPDPATPAASQSACTKRYVKIQ